MEECNKETPPHPLVPLKIYFLPFPTPGHMIPMVNLARVFASRGEDVTIITTPSNAEQLILPEQLRIHVLHDFPSNQVGLPSGLENLSSAKDSETAGKLLSALNLLMPQIKTFVQQYPPHVFVHDMMFRFSHPTILIPTIPFIPMPLFTTCIFEAIYNNPEVLLLPSNSSLPFTIPGNLPHSITLPVHPSHKLDAVAVFFLQAKHNAKHGIIVNSFAELEPGYAEYYEKLTGVKVWHLGFTSLMLELHNKIKNTKECSRDDDDECLSWLNSKELNSVVYICFGSLCRLNREQYLEMARGLHASGHRFLWVVPKDDEEFCLPEGFDGDNRGMVVTGWVPQVLILKHPAIGGFFNHCGWTSVGEAISAGVPMITMPRFAEQFFNEKLLTEVHGVGVEVGAWEWSLSQHEVKKKVVSWELIEKAVRKLMEENEGGRDLFRKRAKEMEEKACKAVQQGGSSYHDLTTLIQSLKPQTDLCSNRAIERVHIIFDVTARSFRICYSASFAWPFINKRYGKIETSSAILG